MTLRSRVAVVLALALLSAPALAQEEPSPSPTPAPRANGTRILVHTRELRLSNPDGRDAVQSMPFAARVDHVLKAATLKLSFGEWRRGVGLMGLEVLVNGERVATYSVEELTGRRHETRVIPIAAPLLADRNMLELRMLLDDDSPCPVVSEGAWHAIKGITLVTESHPLPLPNNLALLPLPFVDRDYDLEASIPFVWAADPTLEQVRLASIVASWFGTEVGVPLTFPATVKKLPETSAVVLLDGADAARTLGLDPPEGPSASMIDHPQTPNAKLLVLAGRNAQELALAARSFASGRVTLAGETVRFGPLPPRAEAKPYDAPRWIPPGRNVPFENYPLTPYSGGFLTHEGRRDGTIAVRFRVAPDLWTWPTEFIELDLGYTVELPPGVAQPRLDLDFNGNFIATLPRLDIKKGETVGRVSLRVRAEQLRGFNEFQLHVRYPHFERECLDDVRDARVSITPDSTLEISRFGHFAPQPDMSLFVYDGYPFTRVADGGETALVLPEQPKLAEVSTVLSVVSHLSSITGRVMSRLQVLSAEAFLADPHLDKELLVVGLREDNAFLRHWANRLPVVVEAGGSRVQVPEQENKLLETWNAAQTYIDRERADRLFYRARRIAVATGMRHPYRSGRSVIVITASSPGLLPSASELAGHAESRARHGDLLVVSGTQRYLFQAGPTWERGKLPPWTRLQRFFATQWVLLFPGFLLGSLILAAGLLSSLRRRAQRRLDGESR